MPPSWWQGSPVILPEVGFRAAPTVSGAAVAVSTAAVERTKMRAIGNAGNDVSEGDTDAVHTLSQGQASRAAGNRDGGSTAAVVAPGRPSADRLDAKIGVRGASGAGVLGEGDDGHATGLGDPADRRALGDARALDRLASEYPGRGAQDGNRQAINCRVGDLSGLVVASRAFQSRPWTIVDRRGGRNWSPERRW